MENASKALIIAGAILLSILIISLGIMVYNNAKSTIGSANLDAQEIQAFNSKWESYVGTNKSLSDVRGLISEVIASNATENKSGRKWFVSCTLTTGTVNPSSVAIPTSIPNTANPNNLGAGSYEIGVAVDKATGRIYAIQYKAN